MKTLCFLSLFFLLINCKNDTEIKLEKFRNSNKIEYSRLGEGYDRNVRREFKNEIEYGIILLPNKDTVNYWFLSHHDSNDGYGGTIFEFPKGNTNFVKGVFCCELQLPNKPFISGKEFMKEMNNSSGERP